MNPENAKAHDQAIEALIAASLREPDAEAKLTDEEISRYVDQRVTLSAEDEDALKKTKAGLADAIRNLLREPEQEKSDCTNATPTVATVPLASRIGPSDEFVEAVVLAELTRLLSSPQYPLGRFRYNKLAYFSHRKAEDDVNQHFLKKAAGPYSPWARYQGPEKIAMENGYVKRANPRGGWLPGDKIEKIEAYVSRYPVSRAVEWVVGEFHFTKNEELELLATVDFAALDLRKAGSAITPDGVRRVISENEEWAPKLERTAFSDENICRALNRLRPLFPATYGL